MRYLSICSGIEAATVAWHPLGMEPVGFAEIDKFPSAVLKHHYPQVPNFGDFTKIQADDVGPIDLLVGGTPCQDFSIAGLRAGMAGDRGNLTLEFLKLAQRLRPRWLVWENVPGVLSSNGGRDFGAFLGGLVELGHGFAYRVLDAQYFRLAQRRKRVFVVGYLGDWRRAAAVLFERQSLSWNPPPRSKAWKDVAPTISARVKGGGGLGTDFDCDGGLIAAFGGNNTSGPIDVATAVNSHGGPHGRLDFESETFVTVAFSCKDHGADAGDIAPTLRAMEHSGSHANAGGQVAIAVSLRGREGGATAELSGETMPALRTGGGGGDKPHCMLPYGPKYGDETGPGPSWVRRLTPMECERLQGFPDGYTAIPYRGKVAADGPRYRALGNSMAVPCMAWLGRSILSTLTQGDR